MIFCCEGRFYKRLQIAEKFRYKLTKINEGAKNLRKLKDRIDTTKMKEASFLMVLTAVGRYAYRRDDGVLVVPLGCLRN